MRVARPRFLPLCLLPLVTACVGGAHGDADEKTAVGKQALGGIEGSMEAALDAPWRIEPALNADGSYNYGQIPIQLTIHDANLSTMDGGSSAQIGKFCEITIEENNGTVRTHRGFNSLLEVETTTGSWLPGTTHGSATPPPHRVCKPSSGACGGMENIGPTSEWHAGVWHTPQGAMTPGRDIPLTLKAKLTRNAATSCSSTNRNDFLTVTNHVRVHLGEAPLPRFDNGWLYGDLHYHAQGTDNEGESGYHQRGVIRALGALGVDFVLASDHASASEQVVDVDPDVGLFTVTMESTRGVLRDLNDARFRRLHNELWRAGGVNSPGEALLGPGGGYPQGFKSHGVVPQIFQGGEVDVIGEIGKAWDNKGFKFGNGLFYDVTANLCGGYDHDWVIDWGECESSKLREDVGDAILFKDVQGIHDYGYTRAHMVYLPRTSKDASLFVGSYTGKYGGGGRRMTKYHQGKEGLLPEIERKGYAFLAHHVPGGSCPNTNHGGAQPNGASMMTSLVGGEGPDAPPYTDTMLAQAFQSPAVLGLEFWNEDTRLCTEIGAGDAKEIGFSSNPTLKFETDARPGFESGQFELAPWYQKANGSFQHTTTATEWTLHHGAASWDQMLRDGIDPVVTSSLSWLPAGDPRRVFMGGGSDAHGDLNYRRAGYMLGTSSISDTAIAKVRNLVFAGAPDSSRYDNVLTTGTLTTATATSTTSTKTGTFGTTELVALEPALTIPRAHSQEEVVNAMKEGNFAITDGPALRVVVDKNRNGVIDATDTPMGGIVELNGESTLPILVEWKSTAEFGAVSEIQLYVGVQSGGGVDGRASRTYAVNAHGPRSEGIASSAVETTYTSGGRTYSRMKDGYWIDPTGLLRITGTGMAGLRKIDLPISAFQTSSGRAPERMYVRAFAQTVQKDAYACATNDVAKRSGACIRRYAYSNPVWAIPAPRSWTGACLSGRPRAMDRDGDSIPDGCDACPDSTLSYCFVLPGGGELVMK